MSVTTETEFKVICRKGDFTQDVETLQEAIEVSESHLNEATDRGNYGNLYHTVEITTVVVVRTRR